MANGWLVRERDAWVATTAVVTGHVDLAEDVSIWYGCSVRGDEAKITIGARTNLQDNVVVHGDPGEDQSIGEDCTVGHGAILHGMRVGDRCLVGMGAILLQGSEIGDDCIVAAGTVVTEKSKIPPRSVVMGVPGKVIREVTDEEVKWNLGAAAGYVDLALKTCGRLHERPV